MTNPISATSADWRTFTDLLPELMRRGRPLAFVGMMGAGKSTLSRQFSVLVGLQHHDTDQEIEKRIKMSISAYFATEGEAAFRALESEVIGACLQRGAAILALGGGAFINPDLRKSLLREADCLYLDVPREELWRRVKYRLAKRPLLDRADPRSAFDALYGKRTPIYAEAPIRMVWRPESLADTARRIKDLLWAYIEADSQ